MAIEDWIDYSDVPDEYYDPEPRAFDCACKWCGEIITMTPRDDGRWKPMQGRELHLCRARLDAQSLASLDCLPDLSLPKCQFCKSL